MINDCPNVSNQTHDRTYVVGGQPRLHVHQVPELGRQPCEVVVIQVQLSSQGFQAAELGRHAPSEVI